MSTEEEVRNLVCELCRNFYEFGWVTGTGGSISIRLGDRIFMTPSGVQKERIKPDDLFVVNKGGDVLTPPSCRADGSRPKLSDCAPLFLHAYNQRDAGAVLHSHGMGCNLVTMLVGESSEFRITQQEMIKGIEGHGYYDELVIPIIENTAWEHELADSLGETIAKYPKSPAVLVRRHGMYVWGRTWEAAKRHAECLHYLFDSYIEAHKLGLAHLIKPQKRAREETGGEEEAAKKVKRADRKVVLLDIEGTVGSISFVKDVLFPYSAKHVRSFLESHSTEEETSRVLVDLVALNAADRAAGQDVVPFTTVTDLDAAERYVHQLINADRKVGPLKTLQGQVWAQGYASGELVAHLFPDVAPQIRRWVQEEQLRVAIYSSGSRQAQRLYFAHTEAGSLLPLLSAHFDTSIGAKVEAQSYREIALTLGLASAAELDFVTDSLAEAQAARQAGAHVYLAVRPGNPPLPAEAADFPQITSLESL